MQPILRDYSAIKRSSSLTSKLTIVDETILDLWGVGPNRAPVNTHHPAVITHPVTRLKALNVTNGFVTGFAELKKKESG
jgi:alpha-ketoglutarate-dependent taurine dioxygenase